MKSLSQLGVTHNRRSLDQCEWAAWGLAGFGPTILHLLGPRRALYSHKLTEPRKNQLKPVRLLSLLTEQPPEVREHKPLPRSQQQNSRVAIQGPASPPRGAHTHSQTTPGLRGGRPLFPCCLHTDRGRWGRPEATALGRRGGSGSSRPQAADYRYRP